MNPLALRHLAPLAFVVGATACTATMDEELEPTEHIEKSTHAKLLVECTDARIWLLGLSVVGQYRHRDTSTRKVFDINGVPQGACWRRVNDGGANWLEDEYRLSYVQTGAAPIERIVLRKATLSSSSYPTPDGSSEIRLISTANGTDGKPRTVLRQGCKYINMALLFNAVRDSSGQLGFRAVPCSKGQVR